MPKTISKRITNGTGKSTSKPRLKVAAKKKIVASPRTNLIKDAASNIYHVENDPMIPLLKAAGFREMTDAEYEKVQPYLMPKKTK
jgi:hypothetical protein